MRRPAFSWALLLAGLVGPLAGAAAAPAPDAAAARQALWTALNQERARSGTPPLALQPALERVAQERADEIGRHGSLSDPLVAADGRARRQLRAPHR